jgi:SPW repeat
MATRTNPNTPTSRRAIDWRSDVVGASGLNIIAGIWLIISPWVLDFQSGDSYWNPIVFGAIVGAIALIRAGGAYRAPWLSWINGLIGIWLFVSGWWLASSSAAQWNDWVMGVAVFVLAMISATASESFRRHRRPGDASVGSSL